MNVQVFGVGDHDFEISVTGVDDDEVWEDVVQPLVREIERKLGESDAHWAGDACEDKVDSNGDWLHIDKVEERVYEAVEKALEAFHLAEHDQYPARFCDRCRPIIEGAA